MDRSTPRGEPRRRKPPAAARPGTSRPGASRPGASKRLAKPTQPKDGPRVDPRDPVEEASYESFPASDPPAFNSPERAARQRAVEAAQDEEAERQRLGQRRGEDMQAAATEEELDKDAQNSRDDVHERDHSGT